MLLSRLFFCGVVIVLVGSDWCDGLPRPSPQFLPVAVRLDSSRASHRLKTSLKVKDDQENSIYEVVIKPLLSPSDLLLSDEKEIHGILEIPSHKTVTENTNEVTTNPSIAEEKESIRPIKKSNIEDVMKSYGPRLLKLSKILNEKNEATENPSIAEEKESIRPIEKSNIEDVKKSYGPRLLKLSKIPNEEKEATENPSIAEEKESIRPIEKSNIEDVKKSFGPRLLKLSKIPNEENEATERTIGQRPAKRRRIRPTEGRTIIFGQSANFALKTINDEPAMEVLMNDKASAARDLKDATESAVFAVQKLEDLP